MEKFVDTEIAARLEGMNYYSFLKRIQRGKYPEAAIKKIARENGGFKYEINVSALSVTAHEAVNGNQDSGSSDNYEERKVRKERSDKGSTKIDGNLLIHAAAEVTQARASSPKLLKKNFGYKKVYRKFITWTNEPISYRRFIDLVKPFVDKQAQKLVNLGPVRYKNSETMKALCDYSVYEPMQMIQSDHTQADVLCVHEGKVIRPWMAFHNSVGDRYLNYPTICERPDSYSLADNLVNFVFRCGLSRKESIYKTDNGKAMLSRVMTKDGRFEDVAYKGYNIEERHLSAMRLMGLGTMADKGTLQNLGLIETHSLGRQPWTKQIERQFGIGGTMDYFTERPEYTGRKYEEKPERLAKMMKNKTIWSSEELVDFIIDKIDDYNNRRHSAVELERKGKFAVPHLYDLDLDYFQTNARVLDLFRGLIVENMNEVYRIFNDPVFAKDELSTEIYSPSWVKKIYELCGWQSRAIPPKETLAMMTMPVKENCTIHPYGINLNGLQYINYKLQPFIGRKANIRYSPSNVIRIKEQSGKEKLFIKEVYVFLTKSVKGKSIEDFICIAEPHPRVVQGLSPQGYAKTFISIRNKEYQETSRAAKITSNVMGDRESLTEVGAPIFSLNPFRDQAAKQLHTERENKKITEIQKAKNNAELEDELSAIYGTNIGIQE